jgi:polar amino acid transport system substrate-binding protein
MKLYGGSNIYQCSNYLLLLLIIFPLSLNAQQSSKDTIMVATHIFPPMVYIENEQFKGKNVEVMRLLAKRMNKNVEFIYCPFARCLLMTYQGQADMMVGIYKTDERQVNLDYVDQPFSSMSTPVRFYLANDSSILLNDYDDLKELSIGVLRGASYFPRFDQDTTLNKVEMTTHKQLIDMLLKRRIDTFLGREISIKTRMPSDIYNNEFKLAPYIYSKKLDSYIVISKKSPLINELPEFKQAYRLMFESGEVSEILNK